VAIDESQYWRFRNLQSEFELARARQENAQNAWMASCNQTQAALTAVQAYLHKTLGLNPGHDYQWDDEQHTLQRVK
jgi:hypothetical protein